MILNRFKGGRAVIAVALAVLFTASACVNAHPQGDNIPKPKSWREIASEEFEAKQAAAEVMNAALATQPLLGRKALPPTTAPAVSLSPRPVENITIPYTIEELGWTAKQNNVTENENQGRSLRAVVRQTNASGNVCRLRKGKTLSGGGLKTSNGSVLRIRNIQSAGGCCSRCLSMNGCGAWTWSRRTKICYPKSATGWRSVKLNYATSGVIAPRSSPTPVSPSSPKPFWEGKLKEGNHALNKGFAKSVRATRGSNNKYVVRDPTKNSSSPVIKTVYPAGCWSPSAKCNGGALFYAWPGGAGSSIGEAARLEYDVYFPTGFPWNKGGKLPGLTGGGTGCGGGEDAGAAECMSARLMWRRNGDGEAYLYHPNDQAQGYCNLPLNKCEPTAGTSFGRGSFKFVHGRWMKIAITVRLNDPGKYNGVIQVDVDGINKISYNKMNWRNSRNVKIDALVFATWFGGSNSSWAPKQTVEAYWRNFKIYKLD